MPILHCLHQISRACVCVCVSDTSFWHFHKFEIWGVKRWYPAYELYITRSIVNIYI